MQIIRSKTDVFCPILGKKETVYYQQITNTTLIHCNGCEHCNGSSICQQCIANAIKKLKDS